MRDSLLTSRAGAGHMAAGSGFPAMFLVPILLDPQSFVSGTACGCLVWVLVEVILMVAWWPRWAVEVVMLALLLMEAVMMVMGVVMKTMVDMVLVTV